MPIINTQVKGGGGVQPTGTIAINTNGVHDVTNYANADVQVPTTAPDNYLEFDIDASGKVTNSKTTSHLFDFSKVKIASTLYLFGYAYYYNENISGKIDLSNLVDLRAEGVFYNAFNRCTGITSVDLSSFAYPVGPSAKAFYGTFASCTGLTSVDLSSLRSIINSDSLFYNCFASCTGLTSIDLSSLVNIGGTSTYMGSNGFSNAFYGCSNLASVNLSNLTYIFGSNAMASTFYGCSSLTSVRFPRLKRIQENNCLNQTFANCTSLQHIYFDTLYFTNNNLNGCFPNMLKGVTGCTVHFPAEWETTMQTWSNVQNGFGGTNTTVLFDLPNSTVLDLSYVTSVDNTQGQCFFTSLNESNRFPNITSVDLSNLISANQLYCFYNLCYGATSITSVNLGSLVEIDSNYVFVSAFRNCTSLTSVNISKLEIIGFDARSNNICQYMFAGCTSLTNIDLSSLTTIKARNAFANAFNGCTNLSTVNLSSLKMIEKQSLTAAFKNCTSLTSISFPALKLIDVDGFYTDMLSGCTALTAIHFPSNMQTRIQQISGYQSKWGASNATIYFDLQATNILTGADTVEYERNPKYDTVSSLAWRVNGSSVTTTPYYTNGTTDPSVGGTIYSDSACTTAVTTISSIA